MTQLCPGCGSDDKQKRFHESVVVDVNQGYLRTCEHHWHEATSEQPGEFIVKFDDCPTASELIGQLIGAASSTRFWSKQDEKYPFGEGTFLEQNASTLVRAAMKRLSEIVPMHHDDDTMHKVQQALVTVGLSDGLISEVINDMQDSGIYFRECKPSE